MSAPPLPSQAHEDPTAELDDPGVRLLCKRRIETFDANGNKHRWSEVSRQGHN
eukprot:COSAG03_NODE_46_length_16816_cov_6.510492_8_plen_53_part_00